MKSKFFYLTLCALMMCLAACDPYNPDEENAAFDDNGAVANGVFSVAKNKKVKFSRGNLQYQDSTNTWRFAEHQYDIIDSLHISPTNYGWIDSFCWGTGNDPMFKATDDSTYLLTYVDWGVNIISNGGNKANQWRTLSLDEWSYLFEGRTNASQLYAAATIKTSSDKIHGIIIMPDNWVDTTATFNYGMTDWNNNKYSLKEWYELQKEGAVFLPSIRASGEYWSSSPYKEIDAYMVWFYNGRLELRMPMLCNRRRHVRLVQDL